MELDQPKGKGRIPVWGNLPIVRPRIPVRIAAELDKIRDQFSPNEAEEAEQYILECLTQRCRKRRLKLYDCRVSATPGINGFLADSSYEEREVPLSLLKYPEKSFLVRVSGDSMQDAGIRNGDMIIAKEIHPLYDVPSNKAIVIAVVNDQLLVKRYRCHHNKYELLSENRRKNYLPIPITPDMSEDESIYIFGVFQRVVPEFMVSL